MQEFQKRVSQKLEKLSNAQIQQLMSELTGKNEMFNSIFQSLPTGLIVVDEKFDLIKINKAAERYLPFSMHPEESKSDQPVWTLIADEEIARFLKDSYDNKKTNIRNEYTVSTSGGSIRFVEIYITPFVQTSKEHSKNAKIGSIIRILDVTDKKNQEILLHRMETLAGLTNIAASVAHEIKNPLGAISIHIQLIQKALKKKRDGDGLLPDPKFAENYLEIINQEIDRLNKIVVDFLMAVRPIDANLELVNPDKLLSDFINFFEPEFNERSIDIEVSLCKDDTRLLIDRKLFREVIVNLAQNAMSAIDMKYEKDPEARKGCIKISSKIENDNYFLYFADDGVGMDETTVARVFEPYFTTKANGTGLGMAMSYKIIKEFSGDIRINSVLGKGTEFMICIPVPQTDKKLIGCR